MTIEQWGFSYVSYLLWHGASVFNSPECKLKWGFLIACRPSSRPPCVNFLHFHLHNWFPISIKFLKHSWVKRIQIYASKGPSPIQRGDIDEIAKIHLRNLRIFFSRTIGPILTKLGTKLYRVKEILFCTNEGPCPFPSGDINEIAKTHRRNLKNHLLSHWANLTSLA